LLPLLPPIFFVFFSAGLFLLILFILRTLQGPLFGTSFPVYADLCFFPSLKSFISLHPRIFFFVSLVFTHTFPHGLPLSSPPEAPSFRPYFQAISPLLSVPFRVIYSSPFRAAPPDARNRRFIFLPPSSLVLVFDFRSPPPLLITPPFRAFSTYPRPLPYRFCFFFPSIHLLPWLFFLKGSLDFFYPFRLDLYYLLHASPYFPYLF